MRNKYTKELLEPIIKQSFTWGEVCRKLNVKPLTGAQCHIKKRSTDFNIDYSHFTGQSHMKGKIGNRKNILEYCFKNSKISSQSLKSRLVRDGHKEYSCEMCGISEWNGEKLSLELDHIDSNHFNNELSNLQILCPNCHAVVTTQRRKERKIVKPKEKKIKIYKYNPKVNIRKVERPSLETLKESVQKIGYVNTGKIYNVSDNCIRKWIKWETAGMVDNLVLETEVK